MTSLRISRFIWGVIVCLLFACQSPDSDKISLKWLGSYQAKLYHQEYVRIDPDSIILDSSSFILTIAQRSKYEIDMFNFNNMRDKWKITGIERAGSLYIEGKLADTTSLKATNKQEVDLDELNTISGFLIYEKGENLAVDWVCKIGAKSVAVKGETTSQRVLAGDKNSSREIVITGLLTKIAD